MNRTKKFLYNSASTGMLQIITMIAGFITPKIMITVYGSEINGLVSSITQFIAYFNLVEAGLSGAAVYSLYKPLAENDYKGINAILSAVKKFYTQSGFIFVSLTVGLSLLYPFYIQSDTINPMQIGILVLILGVNGALEFFTLSKYRALLTADQKTYVISLASMANILLNTTIVVVLGYAGVGIVILRGVALCSIFLRSLILLFYCKKKYEYLDYTVEPNIKALDKRWDALYLQILSAIHTGAPVILITIIVKDLKVVSVYSIFNMVMQGVNGVLSIFISGLSASFGDLISRDETATLKKAYKEFEFIYYGLITIVYSVAFITIMPFVQIYTSGVEDINYDLPVVGFLFVLNGLLYNIKTPQGMLVISAGMYKETKVQTTIQGLLAVVLGAVLALDFGIVGVLTGSIISNLYRDIDLMFFIPKNVTKTRVAGTFLRIIRIFICAGISLVPFTYIEYQPNTFLTWFGYAVCVGAYVLIVVAFINCILDKSEMRNVIRRVQKTITLK